MAAKPPANWTTLPEPVPGVNRRWNGTSWIYYDPATGAQYYSASAARAAQGGGGGGGGGGTSGGGGGLTGAQRDAATALTNLFNQYGLSTLAPKILDYIRQGYSADTVSILLQDTPEYKARFKGNEARRQAGMSVLSPAEYLATESAYRQVMQMAGLPVGFYDQPDDFADFIGKDISPAEIQDRVNSVSSLLNNAPPEAVQMFKQYYSTGDIIAYALDPTRAAPLIERQYKAATLGGIGAQQGIDVNAATAERLASGGVTNAQAQAGFGFIAGEQPVVDKLNAIYGGDDVTQDDLVSETFFNDAGAAKKRGKLASKERASFSGSSGLSSQSLARNDAGAF